MKNLTIEEINEIMVVIDNSIHLYWSDFDRIKSALIELVVLEPQECKHESQYRTYNHVSGIERCDKCDEITN